MELSKLLAKKLTCPFFVHLFKWFKQYQNIFFIFISIFIWLVTAIPFSNSRLKNNNYTLDFDGHVQYTHYIDQYNRIPNPYFGWETYQPPLYYLINSAFFNPSSPQHIQYVDYSSIGYGIIMILCMFWLLSQYKISSLIQFLVVLAITTTPYYYILFTEYNNDALVLMLLGLSLVLLNIHLIQDSKIHFTSLALITILLTLSLYTKYTTMLFIIGYFIYLLFLKYQKIISWKRIYYFVAISALVIILFSPWIYFRNYKDTHKLLPTNFDKLTGTSIPTNLYPFIDQIPFTSNFELSTPFVNNVNIVSNEFSETIFSEWTLGNQSTVHISWIIYWLTLIITISLVKNHYKDKTIQQYLFLTFLGYLGIFIYFLLTPEISAFNVRYVYWIMLPISVIFAVAFQQIISHEKFKINYKISMFILDISLIAAHIILITDITKILRS